MNANKILLVGDQPQKQQLRKQLENIMEQENATEVELDTPKVRPDIRDITKSVFNDVNLSQKREDDESFTDYKIRMKDTKHLIKIYSKGYMRWNSSSLVYDKSTRKYNKVKKQGTFKSSFSGMGLE